MKTMLSRQTRIWICGWVASCSMAATSIGAQTVASRLTSEITSSEQSVIKGSMRPMAQPQFDAGRVPADTALNGVSIFFNRTAAQQADLDALIAAQQDPASPLYHQWLNPDQFADRFGMAQTDIDKVEAWLQQQGFSIDSVARSRNMIRFSGTVGQVERAFSTEMHHYTFGGEKHFAPSTELSVPAAMASIVQNISNLDNFRLKPQVIVNRGQLPHTEFTSGLSGSVFFAPGDIAKAYDITPQYNSGNDGTGQSIAIIGQSAVQLSDITNFQTAAGAPVKVKAPTVVLVPGSGAPQFYTGDETESDLDLEWSSAIAPGADIFFVYTGNGNFGVFDAMTYAIDEKIGKIISISYGDCETDLGATNAAKYESLFQQAVAQGQTLISASGDAGSTSCSGFPNLTTTQQQALNVSYPASSAYVTAVGGTEITAANDTTGTYWTKNGTSDVLNSATRYIPEVAWNDDTTKSGLSSSGGGVSVLIPKPSWQTTLTPHDSFRDVPDIALYSSPNLPGYLYCSSDTSLGISGSCANGFRDSTTNGYLTVAGGTSFAAPVFAGMVAIINQNKGFTTGQGLVNPTLYSLATSGGSYSAGSIFNDIITGNNECTAGPTYCSSTSGGETSYVTATGYDLVTGLGSLNLNSLANASWATATATTGLIATRTTVSPASANPVVGATDAFTITVANDAGAPVTTGTVSIIVDGSTTPITGNVLNGSGQYVYTTSFSAVGTHQVLAQYVPDATHAASTGVGSVYIGGTFSVSSSPATLNVTQGSSGNETITVTPAGGYTGTVLLTFVTSNDTALTNLCYGFTNTLTNGDGSVAVTGTTAVTTQFTLSTLPSDCGLVAPRTVGGTPFHRVGARPSQAPRTAKPAKSKGTSPAPIAVGFAGLLLVGFLGRYSRKFSALAGIVALIALGLTVTACGGGGGSSGGGTTSKTPDPPKGSYTVTVTAQDQASTNIPTASTTFTFVIQ